MSFKDSIKRCDENSAIELNQVYSNFEQKEEFISQLMDFLKIESLQIKTTWLLKKYLENDYKISEIQASIIWQMLPNLQSWEAKLHILQCFSFIQFTHTEKDLIETFLRENLGSENKFVRAWSYNGFYLFADKFSEYQDEAVNLLKHANLTEPASVKARLRNVTKSGFLAEAK